MPSPNLALPYIVQSQAQKEVTHNEALNRLDVLVMPSVLDADRTVPPAAPAEGDRHLVASGATGAWAGHDGAIAAWFAGWRFHVPATGWRTFNRADGKTWVFDGAGWLEDVPDLSPGAWQIPSLNMNWIGLGGSWQNPRYRIDKSGLVTIEGAIQNGTASEDGVIFTLLAGYRPESDLIFPGYSAGGLSRWNIHANGDVEVAASNMFFTSLSGIRFYAA
ncbi:hypothetical protein GCM10007972_18060 [Iodidimonas muriae]|uniref:DUF2793 domain-containing protein n=1 Tax=Iodidimonas muriae TaxID=261467 RepID=A0ABQ2LDX6_9PROT|nr:DUF2793 domain-containing protein [Iodidimonas muriae]GER07174.1 hypothetical protein JCM17843_14840 [Kordiimonadales bacterium JCM 17843]GGO12749.1 hypothetical protein GCM10007972_18060 [Iodidimonas muriae]